jgi:hypothetical protein
MPKEANPIQADIDVTKARQQPGPLRPDADRAGAPRISGKERHRVGDHLVAAPRGAWSRPDLITKPGSILRSGGQPRIAPL